MVKNIRLRLSIEEEGKANILLKKAAESLNLSEKEINGVRVLRKSIDARKFKVEFDYHVDVYVNENLPELTLPEFNYQDVSSAKEVHIIGFGPAGMFAALRCIELGFKPVVIERGKKVQARRKDIRAINQEHEVK